MKVERKYHQIYVEFGDVKFDGEKRTVNTLRAALIQTLSKHGLREVIIQPRSIGYDQNIVRINDPEAEVKWGTSCRGVYLQVSVSEASFLEGVYREVVAALEGWQGGEKTD